MRIALDLGQFSFLAVDLGLQARVVQRAGAKATGKADNAAYPEHAAQQGTGAVLEIEPQTRDWRRFGLSFTRFDYDLFKCHQ